MQIWQKVGRGDRSSGGLFIAAGDFRLALLGESGL
jgi:hypothetical protein